MPSRWLRAVLALLVFAGALLYSQNAYRSHARYPVEEDAVERGAKIGLGVVTFEGPREVVVDSLATYKLRFNVGRAGMKTGGGIRLASAHGMGTEWGGQRLQTSDPASENYLSFRTSTGSSLEWKSLQGVGQNPLFTRYHPWQNINQFRLTGPALKGGDSIEIDLSRVRMQRWDESAFTLKFYVDAAGDDDYLPLAKNPQIKVVGGEADELNVIAPADFIAGQSGWMNVWAGDRFGNPAEGYRGNVVLDLPGGGKLTHRFTAEDRGVHRFTNVTLTAGVHRIRATDGSLNGESNPLTVHAEAPREKLYWGDIHTHTMYSDGRGTPAETYDFGKRVAAIDFAAVTDHSFITTNAMWRDIRDTTNRFYEPGSYVTFLAYEWSGMTDVGGDHNVYTVNDRMPIVRCYSYFNYENLRMYHGRAKGANHVEELFRILGDQFRNENLLVIPHFGGRQGNPAFHNPDLQRQIEIFSDHRRSEDWATKFLEKGYRLGIMASTDNHAGNAGYGVRRNEVVRGEEGPVFSKTSPAERGTSLVAAYAPELTRQGIFQALYHRRTYATTGSRIVLRFEVDGKPMGSEIYVGRPPRVTASAEGTAPISSMRLVKNGRVIHSIEPRGASARLDFTDSSGEYDRVFYYIDLVQADGEKAISSPVWVN